MRTGRVTVLAKELGAVPNRYDVWRHGGCVSHVARHLPLATGARGRRSGEKFRRAPEDGLSAQIVGLLQRHRAKLYAEQNIDVAFHHANLSSYGGGLHVLASFPH
jgi:hypothetical protein